MKKIAFLLFAVVALMFQSCFYNKIDDFSTLVVETDMILTIVQGNNNAIVKPNDVTMTTADGVMTITGGNSEEVAILTLSPETLAKLQNIKIGANSLVVADTLRITNDNLNIEVYDNGSFNGFLEAGNTNITMRGNGEMILAGTGANLTMTMTNSTKYASPTMQWQNATVTLSDTAQCTIYVVNSLTATVADEAALGYIGVLDSNFTVTGNGEIMRIPIDNSKK